MKIVIVDYGMGNIKSIMGALKFIGVDEVDVSCQYESLKMADKLILPGVGSFFQAMKTIREVSLEKYLYEIVMQDKKPILGICLGMQLMGMSSTENGNSSGLGFINASVTKLSDGSAKIPHVGFDQVAVNNQCKLYYGMSGNVDFYFTHSYKMDSENNINQCFCDYSDNFIASYEMNHIAGVQFHPELSQHNGLKLLKNFVEQF